MAAFCTSCGSPMGDGAVFCANCGTAVAPRPTATAPPPGAGAPPPAPTAAAPLAPAAKGSPLFKALAIGLVVIFALGAMGIVGAWYVLHRVKRSVVQAARERGVELSDFTASQYRGRMPRACSLLTAGEASNILGITIERTMEVGSRCDYYARPVTEEEHQAQVKKALEDAQAKAEENGDRARDDANKLARESGMEALTKAIVSSANTGSGPYFSVELNENGKAAIAALKLSTGVLGAGVKTNESLSGIGDDAVLGPLDSMLVFTKNGLGVQIDMRQIGGARDRAIAMAQRMSSRL